MMIYEKLGIKRGDTVSIVGANGKTSLLWRLADELKSYRVLASTSAKIALPEHIRYNFFYGSTEEFKKSGEKVENGISVISGGYIKALSKLTGLSEEDMSEIGDLFDYRILEADGSRGLPLKAYKDHEPPILSATNVTVFVLPSTVILKPILPERTYNYEGLMKIIGSERRVLDIDALKILLESEAGAFKNARGRKIFLINIFDESDRKICEETAKKLNSVEKFFTTTVVDIKND